MLNMDINTNINSIPYLATMYKTENLNLLINDFVNYHFAGYDINDDDVQDSIYDKNNINFNLLTDSEKDYIAQQVEKRINK